MSRSKIVAWGPLTLMLAALLLAAMPARSDEHEFPFGAEVFKDFGKRASGVYFARGQASPVSYFLILTVHQEGLLGASAQVQGTTHTGTAFTGEQGTWERTGDREIGARLLRFNFLPPGSPDGSPAGALHSNAVADLELEFAEDFLSISGTFTITAYPPDVDPLAPDAEPLGPPNIVSLAGLRLTIPDE
ncbi:MAG: hypothetical protein GY722_10410 [bacterium]|nr:hypothetical protein [bacterium]